MTFFESHREMLDQAVDAAMARNFWTPFAEAPSRKIYGDDAPAAGEAAFEALRDADFSMPGHPEAGRVGAETSPWRVALGMRYPRATVPMLIDASEAAADGWAQASVEERVGVCLEALRRLSAQSFLLAHATMHATGQGFAMAFQAGGPHALDRGLEAVALAWSELNRFPTTARWTKPNGKRPAIELDKTWTARPRGVALVIGCQTFPNWNSFPGLFASLATGNTAIVKPHPNAVSPLAIAVRVLREVLEEAGFSPNVALLAADAPDDPITKELANHPAIQIIDYTGSATFGQWLRENAKHTILHTEETGVNSIVLASTNDYAGACKNIAFSLALYSGQMCTAPQNIFIPRDGVATDAGWKSFDAVACAIADAIDDLVEDPAQAASVCGAVASEATLQRLETLKSSGRVIRDTAPVGPQRSASPLLIALSPETVDAPGSPHATEQFGPVAFLVPCESGERGVARAADLAERHGAITASLYAREPQLIAKAEAAFVRAGVNLSLNLTGDVFVNQAAAFSDFHVTGANPAGNASFVDTAFIARRFCRVMTRRPVEA